MEKRITTLEVLVDQLGKTMNALSDRSAIYLLTSIESSGD